MVSSCLRHILIRQPRKHTNATAQNFPPYAPVHRSYNSSDLRALRASFRMGRDQSRQEWRPLLRKRQRPQRLVRAIFRQKADDLLMDQNARRWRRARNRKPESELRELASGADPRARPLRNQRRGPRRGRAAARQRRKSRDTNLRRNPPDIETSAWHDRMAKTFFPAERRSMGRYHAVALSTWNRRLSRYRQRIVS